VSLDGIARELLEATGASRVTIRRGEGFPVVVEALAGGVPSIRDERTVDLRTQPVALEVSAGRQVVQDDSRAAYDEPAFQRMLDAYGGLAAQIVTPVQVGGEVVAILSLHQLGSPRRWTGTEIEQCTAAAERIGEEL
jgi:GAF domain-containing protein